VTDWRCSCGSADVMAVKPGVEPLRRGAVDLFTRLDPLTEKGEPSVAWCRECWPWRSREVIRRP